MFKDATYIVILFLVFVVLRIVVVIFVIFVLFVIYRRGWRMVMTRKAAVDAMAVGSGVLVLIHFTCHASLSKLFHHFDELFAVIF